MAKIHVLLVFGGESSEHDVSLAGAHNVYAALDDELYDISLCLVDRSGKWWLVESIEDDHLSSPQLFPALGQGQFITIPDVHMIRPDVILPILHGVNGEDGTVQGLAKLLHIPIVGPSLISAAVTMDKDITKRLLQDAGIPVVDGIVWHTHDKRPRYEDLIIHLSSELFVKPANAGSSIGVSKVHDEEGFAIALDEAAKHDTKILIERSINAREIEVAVLGNEELIVSAPGEIVPGAEFYSYDDKYDPESTARVIIPADINADTAAQIKQYAHEAYVATLGRGMARIDFFIVDDDDDDGTIYISEINSIPGFTNISMYPKLLRQEGLSYPALIGKLIKLALMV